MLVSEAERLLSKLVFTCQRSAKKRWIIGIQRNHESLIEIAFHRMFSRSLANTRAQIAGHADFDRDLPVS